MVILNDYKSFTRLRFTGSKRGSDRDTEIEREIQRRREKETKLFTYLPSKEVWENVTAMLVHWIKDGRASLKRYRLS